MRTLICVNASFCIYCIKHPIHSFKSGTVGSFHNLVCQRESLLLRWFALSVETDGDVTFAVVSPPAGALLNSRDITNRMTQVTNTMIDTNSRAFFTFSSRMCLQPFCIWWTLTSTTSTSLLPSSGMGMTMYLTAVSPSAELLNSWGMEIPPAITALGLGTILYYQMNKLNCDFSNQVLKHSCVLLVLTYGVDECFVCSVMCFYIIRSLPNLNFGFKKCIRH